MAFVKLIGPEFVLPNQAIFSNDLFFQIAKHLPLLQETPFVLHDQSAHIVFCGKK